MGSSVRRRVAIMAMPARFKWWRSALLWAGVSVAALVAFATYVNVPTALTPEDELALTRLHLVRNSKPAEFERQMAQIEAIQRLVLDSSALGKGIPEGGPREPTDLFAAHQGLCFDRSRTLDKAYAFLGYEVRHVYILYREQVSFVKALLNRGQNSHAVTEVRTAHGWLMVDSNSNWTSVTRDKTPVPAVDVWRRKAEFASLPLYLAQPYWAIPGLYSRHGQFYPPYIQFPNVNWFDLFLSLAD